MSGLNFGFEGKLEYLVYKSTTCTLAEEHRGLKKAVIYLLGILPQRTPTHLGYTRV